MRRKRGFSLLEVMMAIALFGAVVTTILSAQAGLVASNKSAANMSQAIEVGRCRMSEIEEKELRLGYPEIEEKDSSLLCCNDREVAGFRCEWQIERVTLPQQTSLSGDAGLSSLLGGGLGLDAGIGSLGAIASGMPTTLSSPMGTVLSNPLGGAELNLDGGMTSGMQNIGQTLTQNFGAGTAGLLTLVFNLVYPSLKPLLETAIRRVTVVIKWKEGAADRDFTLVQYITNPSRAGLLAAMADAGLGGDAGGSLAPGSVGGSSTAASPGTGITAIPGLGGH
jgi:general secretion pathway protein I